MVDTIHATLYLNKAHIKSIQTLLQTMQSSYNDLNTGKKSYSGRIRNFSIQVNEQRVKIKGSLAKFYNGNNVQALNQETTKFAIEELSDLTSLPIKDAQINRLDLAQNLSVMYPARSYYNYFGEKPYMQRLEQGNGLYYRNTLGERIFYDKSIELKRSKEVIDSEIMAQNLIRFEVRDYGHKNICKRYNVSELNVGVLCEPSFYRGMASTWATEYGKIDKYRNLPLFRDEVYREPKQFCNQIFYTGIKELGGYNSLMSSIKEAKSRNVYETSDQYYALQRKIRSLNKIADKRVPNLLVDEIDAKVRDIVLYCN